MQAITERQHETLAFIATYARQHGYPPSIRDIAQAQGVSSTHSVHGILRCLQDKGYLRRDAATTTHGRNRGLVITPKGWQELGVQVSPIPGEREIAVAALEDANRRLRVALEDLIDRVDQAPTWGAVRAQLDAVVKDARVVLRETQKSPVGCEMVEP